MARSTTCHADPFHRRSWVIVICGLPPLVMVGSFTAKMLAHWTVPGCVTVSFGSSAAFTAAWINAAVHGGPAFGFVVVGGAGGRGTVRQFGEAVLAAWSSAFLVWPPTMPSTVRPADVWN